MPSKNGYTVILWYPKGDGKLRVFKSLILGTGSGAFGIKTEESIPRRVNNNSGCLSSITPKAGSGRTKLEKEEQFESGIQILRELGIQADRKSVV